MAEKFIVLLSIYMWTAVAAQYSPYSLQAAVDALHRREAQLALRDYNNNNPSHYQSQDEEYWNEEQEARPHISRQQLNRLLAKYLTREEESDRNDGYGYETDFDDDNYEPEERKRSFFRERDGKYESGNPTVFRERELENLEDPELTQEFLREIEGQREEENEDEYKEAIRKLWEKYQEQENEIENEIYDEEKKKRQMSHESDSYDEEKKKRQMSHESDSYDEEKKKRQMSHESDNYDEEKKKRQMYHENELYDEEKRKRQMPYEMAPYYAVMQRKRNYPVLPWLPASRKKRFPVAKRSPKMPNEEPSVSGTDEKVAHDLQAIFGETPDDKKKRSSGDEPGSGEDDESRKKEKKNEHQHESHSHGDQSEEHEHDEADSEEHDRDREHEHDEDEDDDHDFDDEDDEDRKKKREIGAKKRSTDEVLRKSDILSGDLTNIRKRKSFQWSKYFGMDRRKKSSDWLVNRVEEAKKKRSEELEEEKKRKKKDVETDHLDNMDHKLKNIEDLIVDETIKYTGAHEGITSPDEFRQLKDHVLSRLATAYSLEKMRRALDKLRQSVDSDNHLNRNEIETEKKSFEEDKKKRVAVKKEKVEFENEHHSSETPSEEKPENGNNNSNDHEENDEDKKKKKKRNGFQRYSELQNDVGDFEEELGAGHFEPIGETYLGNRNEYGRNQCPLLDKMEERCRGVDLLSGDVHQELLPICGVHQLCYICGTSQTACDFQYLSEADSICGHNTECQSGARAALMILRGSPGPQLGPKECLKNPCLYRAMREIGL